jgi:hypothetical protein
VFDVAVFAIDAERCGDELHRRDQLIGGNVFQDLNVLKLLRGGLWSCRVSLRSRSRRSAILRIAPWNRGLRRILRPRSQKHRGLRNNKSRYNKKRFVSSPIHQAPREAKSVTKDAKNQSEGGHQWVMIGDKHANQALARVKVERVCSCSNARLSLQEQKVNARELNLSTHKTNWVVNLENRPMAQAPGLAVSPDGKSILYTQGNQSNIDIALVQNFK